MLKNSKIYVALILVCLLISSNGNAQVTKDKVIYDPSGKGYVQYMRNLAKQKGSRFKIDLSDPKQNAFVMARLASFGKTAKNSPQLFNSLEGIREKQMALKNRGLSTDYTTQATTLADTTNDVVDINDHAVSSVAPSIATNPEVSNLVKAQVVSTVEGGTDMTYVDIVMRDEDGTQLGNPAFVESYAEGTDVLATATANYNWIKEQNPEAEIIVLDSMQINSINGQEDPPQYLMVNALLAEVSTGSGGWKDYQRLEPIDKNGDDVIMLCLNRSHADCDYPLFDAGSSNTETFVRIPFKGEFTFNRRILKLYKYNDPDINTKTFDKHTGIYVYAAGKGGTTVLKNFASYLRLEVDEDEQTSTIIWDIPREEGVFENATLYARYAEINWFMKFNVQFSASWYNKRRILDAQFSASSGESKHDDKVLEADMPKLKFAYSCIAAGTEIRMADGSLLPIEAIKEGMKVKANGAILPVTDISIGIETIPMYRISDHKGNNVLLTESHPVITANKGVIWASEVKKGDRLKTERGTTLVKSVSTEMFDDKIYNLKLGTGINPAPGAYPLNAMYANGILVGDLSMQTKYEFKNTIDKEDVLSRLPEKWHQDYLNSLNK